MFPSKTNFADNLTLETFFVLHSSLGCYCHVYCSVAVVDLMWVPAFIFVCSVHFSLSIEIVSVACHGKLVMDLKISPHTLYTSEKALCVYFKSIYSTSLRLELFLQYCSYQGSIHKWDYWDSIL